MYERIKLENVVLRKGLISEFSGVDIIVCPIILHRLNLYTKKDLEIQEYAGLHYHARVMDVIIRGWARPGDVYPTFGNEDSYFNNILFFFCGKETFLSEIIFKTLLELPEREDFEEGTSILFALDNLWFEAGKRDCVREIEMGFWLARTFGHTDALPRYSEITLLCLQVGLYDPLMQSAIFEFNY